MLSRSPTAEPLYEKGAVEEWALLQECFSQLMGVVDCIHGLTFLSYGDLFSQCEKLYVIRALVK